MKAISRRFFLNSAIASTLFSLLPLHLSCAKKTGSLCFLYLEAILENLKKIRTQEMSHILDGANLIARSIISRNRCFLFNSNSENTNYMGENSPGLPNIFIQLRSKAMAETIRKGDTLLTTFTGEIPEIAKKRGAFIIGITSPTVIDEYEPALQTYFASRQQMGKLADVLIHSHLPVWDGIIKLGEYQFGILPGSGIILPAIITAVAGESYRRSGGIGRTDNSPPQDAYAFIDIVLKRTEQLESHMDTVRDAGILAAEKISKGRKIWVYDKYRILNHQISTGAGVPVFINTISRKGITDGTFKSGDCLVLSAVESIKSDEFELITEARKITDMVVMLCPHSKVGENPLYKKMIWLDNFSPENDGVLTFDSGTRKYLHTGGILNSILLWMLIGETTGYLIKSDKIPYYLMGTHLADSESYNTRIRALAEKRGF